MLFNSKPYIDRRGATKNISQHLFYYKIVVCYAFPVILDHYKPLMAFPLRHAIIHCVMRLAMSLPENHVTCKYIRGSGRHLSQSEDVYLKII